MFQPDILASKFAFFVLNLNDYEISDYSCQLTSPTLRKFVPFSVFSLLKSLLDGDKTKHEGGEKHETVPY